MSDVCGSRITTIGGRFASELGNGLIKVVIADQGGMVQELSYKGLNAHWNPYFRSNSGESYDHKKHGEFWKIPLLYDVAGNFLCAPNFGGDCQVEEGNLPVHGATANGKWIIGDPVIFDYGDKKSVLQRSTLVDPTLSIQYEKHDVVRE